MQSSLSHKNGRMSSSSEERPVVTEAHEASFGRATDLEIAVYIATAVSIAPAALVEALQMTPYRAARCLGRLQRAGLVHLVDGHWQAMCPRDRNVRGWKAKSGSTQWSSEAELQTLLRHFAEDGAGVDRSTS